MYSIKKLAATGNVPPSGSSSDLNGTPPTGASSRPVKTSFVATAIGFAFQGNPGHLGSGSASASSTVGANHGNTSGRTIDQAGRMDDGFVAKNFAGLAPANGSYFTVGGATSGYDGVQQTIATTVGPTYTVPFDLAQTEPSCMPNTFLSSIVTNACAGLLGGPIDARLGTPPLLDTPGPAPAPEPGAIVLLGSGLCCVWLAQRVRDGARRLAVPVRIGFLYRRTLRDFTKN